MKINKGMYIRTEDGYISKCIDIDSDNFMFFDKPVYKNFSDTFDSCYLSNINIKKASFNIIDLIEVGDYVNGNKVTKLGFDKLLLHCKTIECHQENLSRGYEGVTFVYTNNDIKYVVTKEQFDSMKYVVERDK